MQLVLGWQVLQSIISVKGTLGEFLFGLEQHSLGEPWPDVLGVTIIVVVTILFMMGLEKSSTISSLLFVALLCNFAFFTTIGSFHTIMKFWKWCESFKIHSYKKILRAAAICSFAFAHNIPKTQKNNCLKMFTMVFNPLVFYTVTAIIFSLMTHYRELIGTAIPLVQVFENRDVDWARPIIAAFTICVVCLVLTDVLPSVYFSFVKLASKEWRVFVPSIQYQSPLTGAPVLAIFAAVYNTNIHYSKLNQNTMKSATQNKQSIKEKIKSFFVSKPHYIHHLSSPKSINRKLGNASGNITDERECLLLDDYSNKSVNIDLADDSASENDENNIVFCSDDEDSGSSTDIDLIVEEYREGLKVTTIGKFNEKRPSTRITSIVVVTCLTIIIISSITLSLYILNIINLCWPSILGIILPLIITTTMPQNSADKLKETIVPSILFSLYHATSIVLNIVLSSTIIMDIWQGVLFWSLAGLLLFWRCDCCSCDGLINTNKGNNKVSTISTEDMSYDHKEDYGDTIYITR
ncbi:hypothetical protein NQ314_001907 [Rhamnusium bicolor]|uniref:Uncharacterized protein n=1 Tax=Rhamnusium bicolor TaxID=1586634 RepID=A0AAV8ZR92_9CUCU|nr:hypothetical protein NQ314_001907 [Rhamnusium bicolor]